MGMVAGHQITSRDVSARHASPQPRVDGEGRVCNLPNPGWDLTPWSAGGSGVILQKCIKIMRGLERVNSILPRVGESRTRGDRFKVRAK